MSTRLYAVEKCPFIVRLNVIWDCIAGGCCVFPFVPLVLCSQVSQPVWWAYYSTTLPERPCQFRSSPAKLRMLISHIFVNTVWVRYINLTHLYDFALICISLVTGRLLISHLVLPAYASLFADCLLMSSVHFYTVSWLVSWSTLYMLFCSY